jgi:outer membrane protein assembly factor BamD (BamD/ComL family)
MKRFITISITISIIALIVFAGCQNKPKETDLFTNAKKAQESRDFNGAIDAYKQVVETYPKGEHADEAQFMIGFLYANDLSDTTNARIAYQAFLDNYSSTANEGMILSAKWELDNLGKNIEEIEEVMSFSAEAEAEKE